MCTHMQRFTHKHPQFVHTIQHIIPLRCSQTAFSRLACHSPVTIWTVSLMIGRKKKLAFPTFNILHKADLLFYGAVRATNILKK